MTLRIREIFCTRLKDVHPLALQQMHSFRHMQFHSLDRMMSIFATDSLAFHVTGLPFCTCV